MAAEALPSPPSARRAMLRDLRCLYRRHGRRDMARKLARWAVRALYLRTEELLLLKRLDEQLEPPSAGGELRVEPLAPGHAGALAELNRRRCFTRKDRRYADWLARGYRGFLIRAGDEPAGLIWWIDRRIEPAHPEVRQLGIELDEHDVYSFDYYLDERHRGRGNAAHAFQAVEWSLKALGYRRMWGYVVADNRPARWLYTLREFEIVGRVVVHRGALGELASRLAARRRAATRAG